MAQTDRGDKNIELYSGDLILLCDDTEYIGTVRIILEFKGSASLIAYCNLKHASGAHIGKSSNLWLRFGEQEQVSATHIISSGALGSGPYNVTAVLRVNSRGIRACSSKRKKLFSLNVSLFNFHRFWHTDLGAETDKWRIRFEQMDDSVQSTPSGKIKANLDENRILGNQRDALLPKLISGELRIPDTEKMLEEVGV
jgi:hypothetical protein